MLDDSTKELRIKRIANLKYHKEKDFIENKFMNRDPLSKLMIKSKMNKNLRKIIENDRREEGIKFTNKGKFSELSLCRLSGV